MVRGFVYSFLAISIFLFAAIIWFALSGTIEGEEDFMLAGSLLLITFFLVGPAGFALGYWHHLRLHPREPHWDPEMGE